MKWTKNIIDDLKERLNNDNLTRKEVADSYGLTWEQLKNVIKRHKIPYSKTQKPGYTYVCKHCGKEFDNKNKLAGHSTSCEKNPNVLQNIENLNKGREKAKQYCSEETHKILKCEYCGKEVHGKGCLVRHQMWCDKNYNRTLYDLEYIRASAVKLKNARQKKKNENIPAWNKGLTAANNETIRKATEKVKKYYETHDGMFLNKKHTKETKRKLRLKAIEYIKTCHDGGFAARYSKKACQYIEELNKTNKWNLQHAENGGEFSVIGYFLDGYDADLNIAFEYDEPRHYSDVLNNILCEKDITRQTEIINELNCEFYRYNEYLDKFYKVN